MAGSAVQGHLMLPTALLLLVAVAWLSSPAFTGSGAPKGLRGQALPAEGAKAQGLSFESSWQQPVASEESEAGLPSPARLGAAAASFLAALLVAFAPIAEAQAAMKGGRIGGSAVAARKAPPSSSRTAPNVINKTTVIERNTTVIAPAPPPPVIVAPPPVIASPVGYGFGMAPVVVAPAPTLGDVIVGAAVGGAINSAMHHNHGPSVNDRILENQQRQDERQMDRQANQLEDLQRELAELKAKK
jgi:hypothetical protein